MKININWKVRVKNPVFWVQVGLAILLPILVYFGLQPKDITTWSLLGEVLLKAISNPFVVATVLASVWNAINDPTTKGVSDSNNAMTYAAPKDDNELGLEHDEEV